MTPGFQNNPQHYLRTPRTSETPTQKAFAGVKHAPEPLHVSMAWHEFVLALIAAGVIGGFIGTVL